MTLVCSIIFCSDMPYKIYLISRFLGGCTEHIGGTIDDHKVLEDWPGPGLIIISQILGPDPLAINVLCTEYNSTFLIYPE